MAVLNKAGYTHHFFTGFYRVFLKLLKEIYRGFNKATTKNEGCNNFVAREFTGYRNKKWAGIPAHSI